ncbi:hypothetical protein AAFF_G00271930 [Aldrovandia affinis]|uniref:ribonuclease H n=1 Tax=Aldrovandia affinis TaxID=143900 RepID=A0AAD7RBH8_9TELE|nr:hypothetical protein AAFF_G00271930 [Aldrovandia affinis]
MPPSGDGLEKERRPEDLHDFRWLNAKTIKDAHPLPHQADCLAALGGNALFSTMDLTSGFYNVPLHESDRKFTAFTTPMGFLLCYLDDLLVFAPSEEEALRRLEAVFSRLRANNLKLSQKKCNFLRKSDWDPACDRAFEDLGSALLHCAVLAHPDFDRPFILSTDASLDGLGAVLSQVPAGEDKARPIAFASKSLSRSQAKYPAHRLEFLALKWAVCDKFSHWLKGHKFTVWTDNNPLTYIMTKPKLDACEQRWVSKLSPYSFEIKHVPGRLNVVADALSRTPFVKPLGRRLLSEPYSRLLEQVCSVNDSCVQDAFHVTCLPQSAENPSLCATGGMSLSEEEVSSLLSSCGDWDSGPETEGCFSGWSP